MPTVPDRAPELAASPCEDSHLAMPGSLVPPMRLTRKVWYRSSMTLTSRSCRPTPQVPVMPLPTAPSREMYSLPLKA